jgi:hypothetical protein
MATVFGFFTGDLHSTTEPEAKKDKETKSS